MTVMKASQALVQELENWQISHVYGIPADSLIDGFAVEQERMRYIQVRHEEVGALAAVAETKLTGQIGVAMASVGPGAVHLLYGMCDAKMDHTPMLLIMSTVATDMINTHYIQDFDENELFAGLDTYHRQVSDARTIPTVIREAIQTAYDTQSPSVVLIPDDLANQEINYRPLVVEQPIVTPTGGSIDQVKTTLTLIKEAERPVMLVGSGVKAAKAEVVAVSKRLGLPVIASAPAAGLVPTGFENFMGTQGRMGTQPAFEALHMADLVVMVGTVYPFMRYLDQPVKTIQINRRAADLGVQIHADQAVVADAGAYLQQLLAAQAAQLPETAFLKACQQSRQNWLAYLDERAALTTDAPLTAEAVLRQVGSLSESDTIYGLDVGNNTVFSTRMLPFDQQQQLTMSGWFGAMGYGLAAGIAAQLNYPKRRVITVSGDGGFSMVVQDLLTQVQYQLPVINVILENGGYGFIRQEKANHGQTDYGLTFNNANWAGVATNMGALGLRVTDAASLTAAVTTIQEHLVAGNTQPIVLDAVITEEPPLETGQMILDPERYEADAIGAFRQRYNLPADNYPALRTLLAQQDDEI